LRNGETGRRTHYTHMLFWAQGYFGCKGPCWGDSYDEQHNCQVLACSCPYGRSVLVGGSRSTAAYASHYTRSAMDSSCRNMPLLFYSISFYFSFTLPCGCMQSFFLDHRCFRTISGSLRLSSLNVMDRWSTHQFSFSRLTKGIGVFWILLMRSRPFREFSVVESFISIDAIIRLVPQSIVQHSWRFI
jgi:hypothetical protein